MTDASPHANSCKSLVGSHLGMDDGMTEIHPAKNAMACYRAACLDPAIEPQGTDFSAALILLCDDNAVPSCAMDL